MTATVISFPNVLPKERYRAGWSRFIARDSMESVYTNRSGLARNDFRKSLSATRVIPIMAFSKGVDNVAMRTLSERVERSALLRASFRGRRKEQMKSFGNKQ